MQEKIEKALKKIRPFLLADGGDVELVKIEGKTVKVRLHGACGGCPMSQLTMSNAIEKVIKEEVPEVSSVEQV